jgi:YbbR domain-containing protein
VRKKLNIFIASVIFAIILWGSISLSDIYFTNVDVKLTLTNFPPGYTTGSPLPEKIKLRVKSQGWRLVSINVGPETEFRVSVGGDSGKHNISLYNYLESNRWLFSDVEIINIFPDSLRFFVERIISKKLPVISGLDLEFKPGYGLASDIHFKPDSVVVSGPFSILRTMNEIKTAEKSLSPLDSRTETEVNLPQMVGFNYNANLIEVVLDIQRIVDKQFDDITVDVIDIPSRKEVVLLPNKIGFNVRGGIEILGKLKADQFRAYIRYQSLVQDTTGSVTPVLEMPKNVTLQYLKPDRLRYIIRTF